MSTVLTLPPSADYFDRLEARMLNSFAEAVRDWSGALGALTEWEDEHLLDGATPENLARHKATLDRLLRLGRLFALSTAHPEFPDRDTARLVDATMQSLRDRVALWHGSLPAERGAAILREVFGES